MPKKITKFTDRCFKLFFDKLFLKNADGSHSTGRLLKLPFMGKHSFKIRGSLTELAKTYFRVAKYKFSFKDKVPLNVRSLLLYRFMCSSCNSANVRKTKFNFSPFEYDREQACFDMEVNDEDMEVNDEDMEVNDEDMVVLIME